MKRTLTAVMASAMLLLSACSSTNSQGADDSTKGADVKASPETTVAVKTNQIEGKDYDKDGGADAYANKGDHADSKYYKHPDFYNMKSDGELTIIPNFKTMQQTTEWACGNTTSLMVLQHFGKTDVTEWDLATAMKSSTDEDVKGAKPGTANNFYEYGTNVEKIYNYFNNLDGFKVVETSYKEQVKKSDLISENDGKTPSDVGNLPAPFTYGSLYTSENDDASTKYVDDAKDSYFVKWLTGHLKAERPIMVEWGDWDGHWQAIIGYDNGGTPEIGDDMLIFADPYDTSDHWQDGYYYFPLERWFSMWKDRNVAPKPFQLQPYIIVDKK